MAFAWLAKRCLEGLPGNLPSVTGAGQAVVLGLFIRRVKLLAMREGLAAGSGPVRLRLTILGPLSRSRCSRSC